jgi:hypothetical protein
MGQDANAAAGNPGFLDSLTWDAAGAIRLASLAARDGRFAALVSGVVRGDLGAGPALERQVRRASRPPLTLFPASASLSRPPALWLLGELEDGQRVFLALAPAGTAPLAGPAAPLVTASLDGARLHVFPCDLPHLRRVLSDVAPGFAPVPPDRPGLGLGCRMGVLDLPVTLEAIQRFGLCASAIQSSVYRELAPLTDLLSFPAPSIELPGVGLVPLGHTGSSITGQFVAMMTERIARGDATPIAADADHLPLRGRSREARRLAGRLVRESADRTLFTLDPHFCLYGGGAPPARGLSEALTRRCSVGERRELLARYAEKRFRLPDGTGGPDHQVAFGRAEAEDSILRFADPLELIAETCDEIRAARAGGPFAIEVSVDEVPGLTEPHHFYYLAAELRRRNIPVFSLAPGLGFSKLDVDVRDPQGAFQARVRILEAIARRFGMVMGIHSGDGKSVRTRRVLAAATRGNFWYKVSPDRQRTFFRALALCPEGSEGRQLFQDVYRGSLARALELAVGAAGQTAAVAQETLGLVVKGGGLARELAGELEGLLHRRGAKRKACVAFAARLAGASARQAPGSLDDHLIHDYAFAMVGERDRRGRFLHRGRFFSLPPDALRIYQRLDAAYLRDLVRSLGLDKTTA